jgi:alpha-1,3-mannosyltransferase
MTSEEKALRLGPLTVLRTTREALASLVRQALANERPPLALAFCNAHTAETAFENPEFARALGRFALVNDGIGLEIAGRILEGRGFPQNLNGTDFTPWLLAGLERPTRVYLLGGEPGIAEEAGRRFAARFPNVLIVGARDGFFAPVEEETVVAAVAAAQPEILLVALGNPKQELFIARRSDALGAKVMFGVGALFDFTAGKVVRAPAWVRKLRSEWVWRLAQEPMRLARRYTIESAGFLLAVLKLRLSAGARKNP